MSFVATLRTATAADHDMVDACFGSVPLADVEGYRRVLTAHGRALPAIEAELATGEGGDPLPPWRPRTPQLAADLATLGCTLPGPLPFVAKGAARWGALYVIEGSRLGGQLLARTVAAGLPAAYLGSRHLPGEWRGLLAACEARAARADVAWHAAAIAGARAAFALYAAAAAIDLAER